MADENDRRLTPEKGSYPEIRAFAVTPRQAEKKKHVMAEFKFPREPTQRFAATAARHEKVKSRSSSGNETRHPSAASYDSAKSETSSPVLSRWAYLSASTRTAVSSPKPAPVPYTISQDHTAGEQARQLDLLAGLGRKGQPCLHSEDTGSRSATSKQVLRHSSQPDDGMQNPGGQMPNQQPGMQWPMPNIPPQVSDGSSIVMPIPGLGTQNDVPPPLPPPRFLFGPEPPHHHEDMRDLDSARHLDKSPSRSLLTASADELFAQRPPTKNWIPPPALGIPVQLPIYTRGILGAPSHLAISPRSAPFHSGDRSPNDSSDIDRSLRTRTKRNNSDDATSIQSSYDLNGAEDMEMEGGQSLKRLHIDDAYMAGGQKRRVASPGDEHLLAMPTDFSRQRELGSRGSPTPRIATLAGGATMPSVSTSRSNSYISTMSIPATSITTANTFGRRSPVGLSASGSKVQGFFICECCPKKPKRFETVEELNAHEAEKQYECSFCANRFKNKNEAERHQNSLHTRRHSWSCSALSGYDKAFHDSTNRPSEADTCGYCGDEFPRSGCGPGMGALSGGNAPRHATDQDWDKRIRHLQQVHKFRECNSSKKFYRADHFRQHLKHSHVGTSGKWTNMLENACMMDEDLSSRQRYHTIDYDPGSAANTAQEVLESIRRSAAR